jgi:glycine cleavage system H protein
MLSNTPESRRFHRDHLWVCPSDQTDEVWVGISDFAQKQLGKIVFVDLPRIGHRICHGEPCGTVESSKVVSELVAPVTGDVVEINVTLRGAAGLLNEDCYGTGWLMRIKVADAGHLEALLHHDAYLDLVGGQSR